ncbi:MAG: DUF3883 domain-containing protein [Deltaproteobacteria bacterium]|nr:DUF3883 domain-containing protein [Deltaproteobacteria bacterium]
MDLARWYYGERKKWTVKTMHHFQPGYDLEVLDSKGLKHYVEVKGCRNNAPTFHISDTQRAFARKFATDGTYRLFLGVQRPVAQPLPDQGIQGPDVVQADGDGIRRGIKVSKRGFAPDQSPERLALP